MKRWYVYWSNRPRCQPAWWMIFVLHIAMYIWKILFWGKKPSAEEMRIFLLAITSLLLFFRTWLLSRASEKKKTNSFFPMSSSVWLFFERIVKKRKSNCFSSLLFSSLGSKMNGSMRNQRSYLHGLLHYSVTLLMQVSMSLNYLVDQKQLSISPTSLCRNPKKPVTNSERAYLSPCMALLSLGFIVRNLAAFTILQSIFQQVRLESAHHSLSLTMIRSRFR